MFFRILQKIENYLLELKNSLENTFFSVQYFIHKYFKKIEALAEQLQILYKIFDLVIKFSKLFYKKK